MKETPLWVIVLLMAGIAAGSLYFLLKLFQAMLIWVLGS